MTERKSRLSFGADRATVRNSSDLDLFAGASNLVDNLIANLVVFLSESDDDSMRPWISETPQVLKTNRMIEWYRLTLMSPRSGMFIAYKSDVTRSKESWLKKQSFKTTNSKEKQHERQTYSPIPRFEH